jgi:hypothetical protein
VQFAWWDYQFPRYVETAVHLHELQQAGKIRHIGVTNFDAAHLREIQMAGVPVVSNHLQYSALDHRPENDMHQLAKETGFFYLVESFKYDTERYECVQHLIQHYCSGGQNNIAYQYYGLIKQFYENKYLQSSTNGKLFLEQDKGDFFLPYYMILVADKVKETYPEAKQTISKMFEIIFTKKQNVFDNFYVGNLLYNLQFFIDLCISNVNNFIQLFQSYIDFLQIKNVNLEQWNFLKQFEKHGIKIKPIVLTTNSSFSDEECKKSKAILFFSGFSNIAWNYTYSLNNALGALLPILIYSSEDLFTPTGIRLFKGYLSLSTSRLPTQHSACWTNLLVFFSESH